jgi:hypothetical protein
MKTQDYIEIVSINLYEDAEENAQVQPLDLEIFENHYSKIKNFDLNDFILFNAQTFHESYFNKIVLYLISKQELYQSESKIDWQLILKNSNEKQVVKTISFLSKYCLVDAFYYYLNEVSYSAEIKSNLLGELKSYPSSLIMHSIDIEELDEIDNECGVRLKLKHLNSDLIEKGFCQIDPTNPTNLWHR